MKENLITVHYFVQLYNISCYDNGYKNCVVTILEEGEEENEIFTYHNRKSLDKISKVNQSGQDNIMHI
jgi:hypothetical protein